jgi:DNA-directed RNA polymerase subunit beta'
MTRTPGRGEGSDHTIVGGMPRLEQLLDAGRPPGRETTDLRDELVERLRGGGRLDTAEYLLAETHAVYREQGVRIDDSHIEIVLREMLGRLRVTDPGETDLLAGELLTPARLAEANARATGAAAQAEPVVVGVSEAAASSGDFLAAATAYGGIPSLALAAARAERLPLTTLRHALAFPGRSPGGPALRAYRSTKSLV